MLKEIYVCSFAKVRPFGNGARACRKKLKRKQLRMHIILQKRRATSAGWRESHRDADEQIERSQAN